MTQQQQIFEAKMRCPHAAYTYIDGEPEFEFCKRCFESGRKYERGSRWSDAKLVAVLLLFIAGVIGSIEICYLALAGLL